MSENKIFPTFFFSNNKVQYVNVEEIEENKFLYRPPKKYPLPFFQGKKRFLLNLPFQFRCRKFQLTDDSGIKEKTVMFVPHDINQKEFFSPFFLPPEVVLKLRTADTMILSLQQKVNYYEGLLRNMPVDKIIGKIMLDKANEHSKVRQKYYPSTGYGEGIFGGGFGRQEQTPFQQQEQF